jgi:hypothetical protein
MNELIYIQGALKIAQENAKIQQGEKVLIVSDYKMEKIAKRMQKECLWQQNIVEEK